MVANFLSVLIHLISVGTRRSPFCFYCCCSGDEGEEEVEYLSDPSTSVAVTLRVNPALHREFETIPINIEKFCLYPKKLY